MVAYLSPEWVAALDEALAAVEAPPGAARVVVQYVVRADDDSGDVAAYHLDLAPEGVHARPGLAPAADVRFTQSLTTARQVAAGTRSAQVAVLTGEVQVGGDASRLVPWRKALGGPVAAAVAALAPPAPDAGEDSR